MSEDDRLDLSEDPTREQRRLRLRRHGRRAYIRSVYLLPSMMTLGNAVCGFASIYIASLACGTDLWTQYFMEHRFVAAAYLIFLAMICDALDGRLARFTRHTTDFGGQLDSMADVISFGVAPAILMLQICKNVPDNTPFVITRTIWAIGGIYACCAAIRLARFNVSNQHGEQHHFSFLGLPSPGAGGVVAALVLMHQAASQEWSVLQDQHTGPTLLITILWWTATIAFWALPVLTLLAGLLMVSTIRYPHIVNRYMRGRKSFGQLVLMVIMVAAVLAWHRYAIAIAMIIYTGWGILGWAWGRMRRQALAAK